MSTPDLTEPQLFALMEIVTIAKARQPRSIEALRAEAVRLGMDESDANAAIDFWAAHLRETYPSEAALARSQGPRDRPGAKRLEQEECLSCPA